MDDRTVHHVASINHCHILRRMAIKGKSSYLEALLSLYPRLTCLLDFNSSNGQDSAFSGRGAFENFTKAYRRI